MKVRLEFIALLAISLLGLASMIYGLL